MSRRLTRAGAGAVVTAAVLTIGLTGCGRLTGGAHSSGAGPGHVRVDAPPSLLEILIDRDSPAARAQFRALLTLTTQPNEHVIVRDADTGSWIASFVAPSGPSLTVPAPPKPPSMGATQYQTDLYKKAVTVYDQELRRARALLDSRWRRRLASWVSHVVAGSRKNGTTGPRAGPEFRGLARGFTRAAADIDSLEHMPVPLSTRKVIAVLGLDGVSTVSPLKLSSSLRGATVVVTGFPGNSRADAAWSEALAHDGAADAFMLTQPVSAGVSTVVERGLAGTGARRGS